MPPERPSAALASPAHLRSWATAALLLAPLAACCGSACALFLWSLDAATRIRFAHPWLLFLLPVAGWILADLYARFGKGSGEGTHRILGEIDAPTPGASGVPRRMAVFILLGTLGTHLFGGSAGREGTAVQMGGGIAAAFLRSTRLLGEAARVLLLSGMSAGFGGVFGTPWAGAVFAVEIAQRSRDWRWLPVFAAAALLSDATCRLWGIGHSAYSVAPVPREVWESPATLLLWAGYAAGVGIISGLGARTYLAASTTCTRILKRLFPAQGPRAAAGGVLILGLVWLAGTRDYLGLGVLPQNSNSVTLPGFFEANGEMPPTSGLWKMIFTVVTLTSGFRGGEVTPLFFIGAALGQAVSGVLGAPPDLLAGLGMAALFGAAARAPLSCWILGMELFGGQHALWVGVACAVAWACSGADSLYRRPPKRA